jgi:hypothetical protein
MKNIVITLSLIVTLTGCVTSEFHDPRSQTDKRYAQAEAECNFEVAKMNGTMERGGGVVGMIGDHQYLKGYYQKCMAAKGYTVSVK